MTGAILFVCCFIYLLAVFNFLFQKEIKNSKKKEKNKRLRKVPRRFTCYQRREKGLYINIDKFVFGRF